MLPELDLIPGAIYILEPVLWLSRLLAYHMGTGSRPSFFTSNLANDLLGHYHPHGSPDS